MKIRSAEPLLTLSPETLVSWLFQYVMAYFQAKALLPKIISFFEITHALCIFIWSLITPSGRRFWAEFAQFVKEAEIKAMFGWLERSPA